MGTTTQIFLAGAPAAKTGGGSSSLLIIVAIFAVMMIFMFRSQSRRKRAAQDTQRQVIDGARVRTTFGVYGTVIEGDDRNVILEVAPGTRIKMLRQAIAAVVPDDEPDGVAQTMPSFGETEPDLDGDQKGPDLNGDGTSGKPDNRSDLTI
ncbi:MAG TPA: preprotein translocase subunit YajC [Streptosporangiaceae bacterium]|jgi:preprotein translocase subunit YajC|nr:preprotein translocase subunit YajC [Streptosporangiaceae bacterium]